METIPLKQSEMYSALLVKDQVKGMIKAMRLSKEFTIETDWDYGTVKAYHTRTKREVFTAIEKGRKQPWIVIHHKQLFA